MIPNSCVVIGIVDNLGILKENEVFLQVKKDANLKDKKNMQTQANVDIDMIDTEDDDSDKK